MHYKDDNQAWAPLVLTQKVKEGSWFGFAEIDREIPESLRPKFVEMCPFVYNKEVPAEVVLQK